MRRVALCLSVVALAGSAGVRAQDARRWAQQAQHVTIIRDDWGIAHVYGKTDADAVFGMIYAQAEDDFNRVETNYLNSLGRLAEAEGASAIYQDLRQKLFIDPDTLQALYARSPAWLQELMTAWADGLNFYLSRHPEVKPRVITHFEPWMALSFTEGSIGGDIERISVRDLQAFYGSGAASQAGAMTTTIRPRARRLQRHRDCAEQHTAPSRAAVDQSPHVVLFPLRAADGERRGLDAYGAVTWGQIFIYQGFNATAGWMHTSSGVDNIDEFSRPSPSRASATRIAAAPRIFLSPSEQFSCRIAPTAAWPRRPSPSITRNTGRSSARSASSG